MNRINTIQNHLFINICDNKNNNEKIFNKNELKKFNGINDNKVYTALKGLVFDVSKGRSFYGPGGSYEMIAGNDGSKVLAKMKLEKDFIDNPNLDDLTPKESGVLDDWFKKFKQKYPIVGRLE